VSSTVPTYLAPGTAPRLEPLYEQLAALGCTVKIVPGADAVKTLRESGGEPVLIPFEPSLAAALAELPPAVCARAVLLLPELTVEALAAVRSLPVRLVIASTGALEAAEVHGAVGRLSAAAPFGPDDLVAPGTPVASHSLTDSSRRGVVLDEMETSIGGAYSIDPRLSSQLLTIADEFITNAFYNAPVDESGSHRFAHLPRIDPLQVSADKAVQVRWCCDGVSAAVGVRDPYGSLEPARVLEQVAGALRGPQLAAESPGGAGLGLSTAFNAASRLLFDIQPGQRTECIGVVALGSYRSFLARPKSLELHSVPPFPRSVK